jgi:hypothetical protein
MSYLCHPFFAQWQSKAITDHSVGREVKSKLVDEKDGVTVVRCLVSKGENTLRGRAFGLDPRRTHND